MHIKELHKGKYQGTSMKKILCRKSSQTKQKKQIKLSQIQCDAVIGAGPWKPIDPYAFESRK